ncbi:MAG: hypothetical protein M1827_006014 [Pycnora praestabilis]|nr:MAG: hypothetical protein M1827_006014 [Pycnora praestabilis]
MSPTLSQWYKDQYFISTSQALLQTDVITQAFNSDYMYWAKHMSEDSLKTMLSRSLCFGVYTLPQSSSEIAGRASPPQIGLGRLITDESTFAHLTDVFILPEHRGRGLGKWLMECINETLNTWPDLRRVMLVTSGEHAKKFYQDTLGMKVFQSGMNELEVMTKRGPGNVLKDA